MDYPTTNTRNETMKLKTSLLTLCLNLLLALIVTLSPLQAFAQQAQTTVAEGVGADKSAALHDAQRNAVQQVLGAMLSSETLVENMVLIKDKILTRVQGYVKSYDITSEKCTAGECTVAIRAEVEEIALADDVAALIHILPRMNYPTLVVQFEQSTLSGNLDSIAVDVATVEQVLVKTLSDKGFRVADSSAMAAERARQSNLMAMTGDPLGQALETASHLAQVMISGQAVAQDNGASPYNERIHSYGAVLTAKVYETATGKLLASSSAEANIPHHSFSMGTQKAMQEAAAKLTEDLSSQLVQSWLDACYNDHDVTLTVEQISFGDLKALQENLINLSGIARVNQKSFLRGRAEVVVGWQNCNTMRLATMLDGLSVKSRRLEILEVQGNVIRVALAQGRQETPSSGQPARSGW